MAWSLTSTAEAGWGSFLRFSSAEGKGTTGKAHPAIWPALSASPPGFVNPLDFSIENKK